MRNSDTRRDWRHERPLAAFGTARHIDDEPASLLGVADRANPRRPDDASARHRLARLAREAAQGEWPVSPADIGRPANENTVQTDDAGAPPSAFDAAGAIRPGAGSDTEGMSAAGGLARSKRLIATCGLIGAVAGSFVALSLPARYDATATVQVSNQAAPFADPGDQLRVVASGIVLNKVVDRLGLADDPAFNGAAADGSVVSIFRSLLLRDDGAAASDTGHRHAMAARHLADSLSVTREDGRAAIAVTASTGNGETSALIANSVAEIFLSTTAAMHARPAAGRQEAATGEAARALELFLARRGLASGNAEAAADALLKLGDQLVAARAGTADLNGKIGAMRSMAVDAAVGGGLPAEFDSQAMGELRAQYLAIKSESDRAAARLGPRNPERIALDTQLAGARDRIAAELRRIAASLQAELKQAVETEQGLASRLAGTKLDATDLATLRSLREASGQAVAKAVSSQGNNALNAADRTGIVTKAYAPLEASGPPRLPITLAGLLLGLAAGIGIGAARGRGKSPMAPPAGQSWQEEPDDAEAEANAPPSETATLIAAIRRALPALTPIDAGGAEPKPTETAETPYPLEDPMYPVYPDPMSRFAAPQPDDYPQQQFQPPVYVPPHPYGAPPTMAQPYVYTPYAPAYLWQAQPPMPAGFYPYPQPPQRMAAYPQPATQQAALEPSQPTAADQLSLEEIRASLREFREAVRELSENRSRRRYF